MWRKNVFTFIHKTRTCAATKTKYSPPAEWDPKPTAMLPPLLPKGQTCLTPMVRNLVRQMACDLVCDTTDGNARPKARPTQNQDNTTKQHTNTRNWTHVGQTILPRRRSETSRTNRKHNVAHMCAQPAHKNTENTNRAQSAFLRTTRALAHKTVRPQDAHKKNRAHKTPKVMNCFGNLFNCGLR